MHTLSGGCLTAQAVLLSWGTKGLFKGRPHAGFETQDLLFECF